MSNETGTDANRAETLRDKRRAQNKKSDLRNIAETMQRVGIVLADVVKFFESGEVENDTNKQVIQHRKRRNAEHAHEDMRKKGAEARRNAKPKPPVK